MVKIKEIMRKNVVTVDPTQTIAKIAQTMAEHKIGSVVVMTKNKPVGIVTSEDIVAVVAEGKSPAKVRARDLLKREFVTATPDEHILKIAKRMVRKGIKRVPVIERGKLKGILTDKEMLITAPELINVLSEKLKARVERVVRPSAIISGICEQCEGYDDSLHSISGKWMCEDCRE